MPLQNLNSLEIEIESYLTDSMARFESEFVLDGDCYVMKYLPSSRVGQFVESGNRLFASQVAGYTWGDGVYVAPLTQPYTTMMYGCAGIVGSVEPKVVFDARETKGIGLYQEWIRYQWLWYNRLTTTMHADHANRELRNRFRTRFKIDCVLFRPDQTCEHFVAPYRDCWFAMSHWSQREPVCKLGTGYSDCVRNAEWCVVCTEEFERSKDPHYYLHWLGPALRGCGLARAETVKNSPVMTKAILVNYVAHLVFQDVPILIVRF